MEKKTYISRHGNYRICIVEAEHNGERYINQGKVIAFKEGKGSSVHSTSDPVEQELLEKSPQFGSHFFLAKTDVMPDIVKIVAGTLGDINAKPVAAKPVVIEPVEPEPPKRMSEIEAGNDDNTV